MTDFINQHRDPAWLSRSRTMVVVLLAWSLPTSLFGMQVAMVAGIVTLLIWLALTPIAAIEGTPLDAAFWTLVAAVLMSLLLAPGGIYSFQSATSFWIWPTFFVAYYGINSISVLKKSVIGMLLLSVVVACFGIFQSYSGLYPLGQILHPTIVQLLRPAPENPDRYMAVGFFHSRVMLAHVLMFSFCWMFALIVEPLKTRVRLLMATGLVLIWIGMMCTWTRSAPVASALVALGLLWNKLKKGKIRRLAISGTVIAATIVGILLAPGLLARIQTSFSGSRDWGRLTIWQTALDLASSQPVTGIGFGNYQRDAVPLIQMRVNAVGADRFSGVLSLAHNDLLTFFAECGIIGAFALCWLFVAYFFTLGRGLKRVPADSYWLRGFMRGGGAAIAAYLLTSFFHDNLFHPETAFVMWFTLGASLAAVKCVESS
jgi:O-antigen ligase